MTPEQRAKWVCFNFEQRTDDYNEKLYDAVLKQIAAAVAEERERCAKVADEKARYYVHLSAVTSAFRDIAAAIRGGES